MVTKFNLKFQSRVKITPNVDHLIFEKSPDPEFNFIPGQFVTLLLTDSEGQLKRRSYSIASLPSDEFSNQSQSIGIAVAYVPNGVASNILENLKPGDELAAMGPVGRLILKEEEIERYVLVGTGTGIAPYRAMLNQFAQRIKNNPNFQIIIIQGVQTEQDILYQTDFEKFAKEYPNNTQVIFCLSRECKSENNENNIIYFNGYVQNYFEKLNLNANQDVFYLCGNPNMIDQAFEQLKNLGFESTHIRREKYISSN